MDPDLTLNVKSFCTDLGTAPIRVVDLKLTIGSHGLGIVMVMHVPCALVLLLAVGVRAGAPLTLSNSVVRASIDGGGGECTHCSHSMTYSSVVTSACRQACSAGQWRWLAAPTVECWAVPSRVAQQCC